MSPWQTDQAFTTRLLPHCQPQSEFLAWLSNYTSTCVPTPLALVTTIIGSLSFLAWLFAQLPQIYKNYQVRSTTGLSFMFLVVWLLGDTTNLAGAILTKQASWQVLIASYYTFVDCALVFQYYYYTHYLPRKTHVLHIPDLPTRHGHGHNSNEGTADREIRRSNPVAILNREPPRGAAETDSKSPLNSLRSGDAPILGKEKNHRRTHLSVGSAASMGVSPKTVLMISMVFAVIAQASPLPSYLEVDPHERDRRELIGKVVSWISTISYLASRFPQIIKNAQRKSTAGLSITLFIAAFFGNLFYSISLLTNPLAWGSYPPYGYYGWADEDGSDRRTWILLALPFWLGAAGVLSLDFTVFVQFLVYGGGEKPFGVVRVPNERGRASWRRVSGYMRGWVPSPGPDGWRSRLPSLSRESSRPATLRDEARPLLTDENESRPGSPFASGGSSFRPGSPLRPGSPSPQQIARGRPTGSPLAGSPHGASSLSRSYGAT